LASSRSDDNSSLISKSAKEAGGTEGATESAANLLSEQKISKLITLVEELLRSSQWPETVRPQAEDEGC